MTEPAFVPARQSVITVLDFETTGPVAGYRDEPWQIGIIRLNHGKVDISSAFESLLNVSVRPVNKYVPGRYADLQEQVAVAPRLTRLWEIIQPALAYPLAAHNTATEKKILSAAFPLFSPPLWIDTLKVVRAAFPAWDKHRLEFIITELGITDRLQAAFPGREFHDALYDAAATAFFLEYLLEQPGWQNLTLGDLSRVHPQRYYQLRHS